MDKCKDLLSACSLSEQRETVEKTQNSERKRKIFWIKMCSSNSLPYLGVMVMAVVANKMLDECLSSNRKYTMNVVLLEDNSYGWSRPFVQAAVERAIEEDRQENINKGMD